MTQLFHYLLVLHIIAGTIALAVAPGAMVTAKGGLWHRRWGKMYVAAMFVIAATGAVMSLLRPSLFLFIVAIFSFYLVFSGYRVLHRKGPGQSATAFDRAVTLGMILTGLIFVAHGGNQLRSSTMGLVPIVFGSIALFLAGGEFAQYRRPPSDPKWWWFAHMRNMLAGYLATLSAFSVVNLTFLPPVVRWLWPTVIGTTGILLWSRYYRRKFERQKLQAQSSTGLSTAPIR